MVLTAEDIKLIRKYYGITQKQLAKKLGVSQPFIAQLETDKKYAPENVAKKLGISYERLNEIYQSTINRESFI